MATKCYSFKTFTANVDGVEYSFTCWTTNTRNGFCHTCQCDTHDIRNSKIPYLNRTWESFEYESVLRNSIYKFDRKTAAALDEILISKTRKDRREKAESFVKDFEQEYNKLPDSCKEKMKDVTLTSMEQAEGVMGAMRMVNIMSSMLK